MKFQNFVKHFLVMVLYFVTKIKNRESVKHTAASELSHQRTWFTIAFQDLTLIKKQTLIII